MALLELTTLDRVKTLLELTKTDYDTQLTSLIQSVSMAVESYLGRGTLNQVRTVELDVYPRQTVFWIPAYPVGAITSLKSSSTWDFAGATAIASTLYRVEASTGRLTVHTSLAAGAQALEVSYTGGMASNTASFITAYPDIVSAVDMQVGEEFRRGSDPALKSKSFATEKARSYSGELHLLDRVMETLAPYRRIFV